MRAFGAYRFATAKPPLTLTASSGPSFHQALQGDISPGTGRGEGEARQQVQLEGGTGCSGSPNDGKIKGPGPPVPMPLMVLGISQDLRNHRGPANLKSRNYLKVLAGTNSRARPIGPCQLAENIGRFG